MNGYTPISDKPKYDPMIDGTDEPLRFEQVKNPKRFQYIDGKWMEVTAPLKNPKWHKPKFPTS